MSLPNIINLTVNGAGATPEKKGFGEAMLLVNHSAYVDRVRKYSELSELVTDGFSINSVVYKMATQLKLGGKVQSFYVGKRNNATVQVMKFTPTITTLGYTHTLTVKAPGFLNAQTITYTNGGAETATTISTALKAALDALLAGDGLGTTFLTVVSTTFITVTPVTAGNVYLYSGASSSLTVEDTTTDPGIAADIAACLAFPGGNKWWALALDSRSKAEVVAAATAVEALAEKGLFASTADTASKSGAYSLVATDLGSVLKQNARLYTSTVYCSDMSAFAECAWLGKALASDPGTETWKFIQPGIAAEVLSTSEQSNLLSKNMNFAISVANATHMQEGWMASGEYIDNVRGAAWLSEEIQIAVYNTFLAASARGQKIPYTDQGVLQLVSPIRGCCERATATGTNPARFLSSFTISFPKEADFVAADKALRRYRPITIAAKYADAIHLTDLVINYSH